MNNAKTIDRHAIVLDDEPLFLRFASIPFRTGFCGFCTWHLHAFSDPHEALEFYAENSSTIDVVLTDLHMPAMSGLEFIDAVRARSTARAGDVPALLVTSDPPDPSTVPPFVSVVSKPFTKDDVARGLCEVSVVCETGKCKDCGVVKPRPPVSIMRDRLADEQLPVFG